MKVLEIEMPDGYIYQVPAKFIAESRANYYANVDGYEVGSDEWKGEVEYCLSDRYALVDWAQGNMNWEDVRPHAKKLEHTLKPNDMQRAWVSETIDIVEVEG